MQPTKQRQAQSTTYRAVTAGFGVFFIAVALTLIVVSEISLKTVIAAVLVGGLGLDAVVSALRSKKSLLARIGPLP